MGNKTKISWTDRTWNPTRGCSRISEGCRNCYAERFAARFAGPGQPYAGLVRKVEREVRQIKLVNGEATGDVRTVTVKEPRWTGEVRVIFADLTAPLRWRQPQRIFVDSMSDLFHPAVHDDAIDMVVAVMMVCALHERVGGHTFQTLTKRANRMRAYFTDPTTQERVARAAARLMDDDNDAWYDEIAYRKEGLAHPLLWWGVSVEDQAAADERVPELLATPAAVRFLSCEPLIGPVTLGEVALAGRFVSCPDEDRGEEVDPCAGCPAIPNDGKRGGDYCGAIRGPRIDWVIAGCESGPGARPCSVEWLRSLRDQCGRAEVAFFLKQAGEEVSTRAVYPSRHAARVETPVIALGDGSKRKAGGVIELPYLDGVQHVAFPETSHA